MITFMAPLRKMMVRTRITERLLSESIGVSRTSVRKSFQPTTSMNIETIHQVARYFDHRLLLLTYPQGSQPETSAIAISFKILSDGFDSWKIHLMDFVDEFRKTLDMRMLVLPPCKESHLRLKALIVATTLHLCAEVGVDPPTWAAEAVPLAQPWFVSGMESLKATALLESPMCFRAKNIFVQDNFLKRA